MVAGRTEALARATPTACGVRSKFIRDSAKHLSSAGTRRYWTGAEGCLWWFYYTGESTLEVWSAYTQHCRNMLDSGGTKLGLVCIAHRAQAPDPDQRTLVSEFIKAESERLTNIVGSVLVVDSPLHILALKAVNWLVAKPYHEIVCGSPEAAAVWLQDRGARADPELLLGALRRNIPAEFMWRG